jgi:hypothetical protein
VKTKEAESRVPKGPLWKCAEMRTGGYRSWLPGLRGRAGGEKARCMLPDLYLYVNDLRLVINSNGGRSNRHFGLGILDWRT